MANATLTAQQLTVLRILDEAPISKQTYHYVLDCEHGFGPHVYLSDIKSLLRAGMLVQNDNHLDLTTAGKAALDAHYGGDEPVERMVADKPEERCAAYRKINTLLQLDYGIRLEDIEDELLVKSALDTVKSLQAKDWVYGTKQAGAAAYAITKLLGTRYAAS